MSITLNTDPDSAEVTVFVPKHRKQDIDIITHAINSLHPYYIPQPIETEIFSHSDKQMHKYIKTIIRMPIRLVGTLHYKLALGLIPVILKVKYGEAPSNTSIFTFTSEGVPIMSVDLGLHRSDVLTEVDYENFKLFLLNTATQ